MTDKWIALTDVRYRDPKSPEDETYIAKGEEVKGLPKDVMEQLKEAGSMEKQENLPTQKSDESLARENEGLRNENNDLKDRISELEGQLAEANKKNTPPVQKK
jgi:FtsZ-binding cell division protein ZapB